MEMMRNTDKTHHAEARARQPSFAPPVSENGPPMSPFQLAQDDQRRASLFNTPRAGFFRPPMPHRTNTLGGTRPPLSPAHSALQTSREPPSPPVNDQPNDARMTSPPIFPPRRHTSADIRQLPGWPQHIINSNEHLPLPHGLESPFASGQSSGNWPSSPNRTPNPTHNGEQQLRDSLARYQLSSANNANTRSPMSNNSTGPPHRAPGSRAHTPPPLSHHDHTHSNGIVVHSAMAPVNGTTTISNGIGGGSSENVGAGWGGFALGPRLAFKDVFGSSGPPTRRGSVAHLLNPADTVEREDEEDVGPDELRKRKRMG